MGRYLDQFKDKIGNRQAQQILKLLNKQRNSGQIRTIDEFSKRLESLMRDLTSETLKPTLSLFPANKNETIDSESFNFMLDRVQDDLEAGFEEARNIAEVQNAHQAIVKDLLFKNLRTGLAELDAKISLYEFLNKDTRGFDQALSSTFRESQIHRTERSSVNATSNLFLDPRTLESFDYAEDAVIEPVGERLTLGLDEKSFYSIRAINQLFDADTKQSELIVEPPNNKLLNILDNTKGTYWVQSLLYLENPLHVDIKLELDLEIIREINLLEIEPVIKRPILLTDIHYYDISNNLVSLGLDQTQINGPVGLSFKKIATKKLILTFRNINPFPIEFEYSNKEKLIHQAFGEPLTGLVPSMEQVNSDLHGLLGSATIKANIYIPETVVKTFYGYNFVTGFDNIRIGYASYQDKSIYISTPLETTSIGQIGLQVDERRPYTDTTNNVVNYTELTYDNENINEAGNVNSRNFLGSLEYWILKQDFNSNGVLSKVSTFPLLPLGVNRVHHERLLLNEKSTNTLDQNDQGTLIFFSNPTDGNIKVYRNFELLTNETGNSLAVDGWKWIDDLAFRTPNNGERMKCKIQIVDPSYTDIYTVSYTPLVSSTKTLPQNLSAFSSLGGLQVVDLAGDLSIRSTPDQLIVFETHEKNLDKIFSKLFLIVVLRRNSAEITVTPMLEEYSFFVGNYINNKFEKV